MNEYKITNCLYQRGNYIEISYDAHKIDDEGEINEFDSTKIIILMKAN